MMSSRGGRAACESEEARWDQDGWKMIGQDGSGQVIV